jgi:formylglycine-generating enzyme required for sulfatase activity
MDVLQNPIKNAEDIAKELQDNFGFQTEVVPNPSLDDIDNKLAEYERKFNDGTFDQKGQLFIYFSGHGIAIQDNGYFMTPSADPARPHRTAMDYDFYRNKIDQIACQHIMVAIDACHSATFDPKFSTRSERKYGRPGEREFDRVLANHESYRTRVFWTSDGEGNETPDKSSFAYQLLEGLRSHQSNKGYLRSKELYTLYLEKAVPLPGGGSFGSDEPNSCFLFFRNARVNIGDARADFAAWQIAQQTNTLAAYRQYLGDYPSGDFSFTAREEITRLETEERELTTWLKAKATDTPQAYADFVNTYPKSRYVAEAQRRQVVAQNNIQSTTSPSLDRESRGGSTIAPDDFVRVEGGTYIMGCQESRDTDCYDSEKPPHSVTVPTFYLSKYEVTQAQWRAVMGSDPLQLYNKDCDQCPVEYVSWDDIQEFLQKLNAQTRQNYRLPTEAEWEYAARGGNKSQGYLYSGSNDITEVAWYSGNLSQGNTHGERQSTRPVGSKKPNELGFYDMSGNVWEWCEDDWHKDYRNGAPKDGRSWVENPRSSYRELRGGGADDPKNCRATYRSGGASFHSDSYTGFRLARTPS